MRNKKIDTFDEIEVNERISREYLFIQSAILASQRSTCSRRQVGCVLVKDKRIIAMGYNGVLPGVDPKEGLDEEGNSKTVHAETNVIAYCAKQGIATDGCSMYITLSPCIKCAEIIIQAGIKEVFYLEGYRNSEGLELLDKFIDVCHLSLG